MNSSVNRDGELGKVPFKAARSNNAMQEATGLEARVTEWS